MIINHMKHPYKKFEGTIVWKTLGEALNKLEKNNDLEFKTAKEYVVGFLCESLYKTGKLKEQKKEGGWIYEISD